jgi:hypothetical protein
VSPVQSTRKSRLRQSESGGAVSLPTSAATGA